jgi:hypothetical protein
VEQHLPVQLMTMMYQKEIKNEIIRRDQRTVPNEIAWSDTTQTQAGVAAVTNQPLDRILFICISLLFIAERLLAFYRRQ